MSEFNINVSDYKAPGVYVEEVDNSIVNYSSYQSALRLAVGFNGKAPFNRPIYIESTKDCDNFLGPIDRKLERKGCFTNRAVRKMIEKEAVYVINLLKTDDKDTVGVSFPVYDSSSAKDASLKLKSRYDKLFDKSNFWVADDTAFVNEVFGDALGTEGTGTKYLYKAPLFGFGNCGTDDISLIVRKAEGLTGYSITMSEWFGGDDQIPYNWINPTDLVCDYFIQVIAIKGLWGEDSSFYNKMCGDATWKSYFTESGLKKGMLDKFISLDNVTVLGNWTGCIIPNFEDKQGRNKSIDYLINSTVNANGLLFGSNATAIDAYFLDSSNGVAKFKTTDGVNEIDASFGPDVNNLAWKTNDSAKDKSYFSYVFKDVSCGESKKAQWSINGVAVDSSATFFIKASDASVSVGDKLRAQNGTMTKVKSSRMVKDSSSVAYYKVTCYDIPKIDVSGADSFVQYFKNVADLYETLKFIPLSGLVLTAKHLPGYDASGAEDNEAGVEKIYGMLDTEGIHKGLLNDQLIDFRYVIDTMAYGMKEKCGAKNYLAKLAADKKHCLAICNTPSMTQFARSTSPCYCEDKDHPQFNVKYIPEGGNGNYAYDASVSYFSLPDDDDAAKHSAFFAPFLKYQDGSRVILVPPAADVSNVFMNKYHGGDPYKAVANMRGVIENKAVSGLEYLFDETDRGYLTPFGINPIITDRGAIKIYGDQTAYQKVNSDLSKIHARELLNTIALNCKAILKDYVFAYNTANTRAEIITRLDPMFQAMMRSDALVRYDVQCDDSNNTKELIDQQFCLVEISVWMSQCMEKIVVPITVNRSTTA